MDKRITSLIDDYRHGGIDRREFLKKLAVYAGSTAAAMALIPAAEVSYADLASLQDNDHDLVTEFIKYTSVPPFFFGNQM